MMEARSVFIVADNVQNKTDSYFHLYSRTISLLQSSEKVFAMYFT